MGKISRFINKLICIPIRGYQFFISPILGPHCRFSPSCSQYALTSIENFGVLTGLKLTCLRLLRCHPWSKGGFDPVVLDKEKL